MATIRDRVSDHQWGSSTTIPAKTTTRQAIHVRERSLIDEHSMTLLVRPAEKSTTAWL